MGKFIGPHAHISVGSHVLKMPYSPLLYRWGFPLTSYISVGSVTARQPSMWKGPRPGIGRVAASDLCLSEDVLLASMEGLTY